MTGTMLPTVWTLRDVTDVEALCRGVLRQVSGAKDERAGRPGDWLQPCDYDTSLAFLLGEVHVQELVFLRKGLDTKPGMVFKAWLFQQLRSRLIDEWRSSRMFGRDGRHRVPALPPIEGDDDSWDVEQRDPMDDDRSGASRLERVVAEFTVDPPDARDVALRWVLTDGDREVVRTQRRLGLEPVDGATPRISDADQFLDDVIGEMAA